MKKRRIIHTSLVAIVLHVFINSSISFGATYSYDAINRLTAASYGSGTSIGYSYDAAGNITAISSVPDASPPTVESHVPTASAANVSPSSNISTVFSEPISSASAATAVTVTGPDGIVVGQSELDFQSITFTPSTALTLGTTYTVAISGATDFANNVQTSTYQWTFTVASLATAELTVQNTGAGTANGTVTSNPEGINCSTGNGTGCIATFPINDPVTLNTIPAWYYCVDWTGCTAAGNSCEVTMDAAKIVAAAFGPAHNAQILTKTGFYGKLADAYAAAGPSGTIQARDAGFVVFVENALLFDKDYSVVLDGGKNSVWGNSGGYTAIKGPLKIQKGRVTVQGVKIQ